jgi:hypothetical protein
VWRTHTVYTDKLYKPCMDRIPACKYIHYEPTSALDTETRKQRTERCVLMAHSPHQEGTRLIGSCGDGRTLLAYKTRFGYDVPATNKAWTFTEPVRHRPCLVVCHFPHRTGSLTTQIVPVKPNAFVADLVKSYPGDDRAQLEPLDLSPNAKIYDLASHSHRPVSVFFLGPAHVARRALPEATRRTTNLWIMSVLNGQQFTVRVDTSEHGDLVIELKKMVQERVGTKPCQQRLFTEQKELLDHWRLRDVGLRSGATVNLVVQP